MNSHIARRRAIARLVAITLVAVVCSALLGLSPPAVGGTKTYTYDELGRLRVVESTDGKTTTYTLDAAGNRLRVQGVQAGSAGNVQIFGNGASVPESQAPFAVTLRRAGGNTGTVGATVTVTFGTASAGDVSVLPAAVSWAAGDLDDKTVTVTIVDDALVETNETFNVVIGATGGATLGTPSSITFTIVNNDGVDTTPPPVPTNFRQTGSTATSIALAWNASTDPSGVPRYEIDRCVGVGCVNFQPIVSPTGLTYNDVSVVETQTYGYRIRAVDGANLQSPSSNPIYAQSTDTTAPTVPTGLATTGISATQVTLTWSPSSDLRGVTGYRVERCTGTISTCSTFGEAGIPTAAPFSNAVSSLTTYVYRVLARDAQGNWSAPSAPLQVTSLDGTPPSVPTGLTATVVSSRRIDLTWSASTDNSGVAPTYKIYRNSTAAAEPTASPFVDDVLQPSTSYTYRISAVDGAGNESALSSPVSSTTGADPDETDPTVPAGVDATSNSSSLVRVFWAASSDQGGSGLSHYRVYRGGTFLSTSPNIPSPFYEDATVSGSVQYSYTVSAVDFAGNESVQSAAKVITVPDTLPPTTPTNLAAVALNGSTVRLTWNASTDPGGSGIQSYRVYRNGTAVAFAVLGTTYDDSTAAAGTSYTYTVTARDNGDRESPASDPANVTTPNVVAASIDLSYWSYTTEAGQPAPPSPPPVVCTASGGAGGYTYQWVKQGGDADLVATFPNSSSTRFFRGGVGYGWWTATFRCVVTDSLGASAQSTIVTVEIERASDDAPAGREARRDGRRGSTKARKHDEPRKREEPRRHEEPRKHKEPRKHEAPAKSPSSPPLAAGAKPARRSHTQHDRSEPADHSHLPAFLLRPVRARA